MTQEHIRIPGHHAKAVLLALQCAIDGPHSRYTERWRDALLAIAEDMPGDELMQIMSDLMPESTLLEEPQ